MTPQILYKAKGYLKNALPFRQLQKPKNRQPLSK